MCTHAYLTESLGLSYKYKHIGGQYGHAEVHQDDGSFRTDVSENEKTENYIFSAVITYLQTTAHSLV